MQKKPEIIVFAGPNGSGKTTVTKLAKVIEPYVNADDIKRATLCSDLEAAQKAPTLAGGHDVPEDKIRSRYQKALALIPELIPICDVCHIYDNTTSAFRIFKKRKDEYFAWENDFWNRAQIEKLTGIYV